MDIIFATKNKGKLIEVKAILSLYNILGMEEAGIHIEVEENGETFEENAMKKAVEIMAECGKIVLSDDSGIEIDYFDKAPGVHSARYLGHDMPYIEKNAIILDKLKDVPMEKRTARYVAVIAAALPDGRTFSARGVMEGYIGYEPKGGNGFGYDPIFYLYEYGESVAQIPKELKNKISHRGKALEAMKEILAVKLNQ